MRPNFEPYLIVDRCKLGKGEGGKEGSVGKVGKGKLLKVGRSNVTRWARACYSGTIDSHAHSVKRAQVPKLSF